MKFPKDWLPAFPTDWGRPDDRPGSDKREVAEWTNYQLDRMMDAAVLRSQENDGWLMAALLSPEFPSRKQRREQSWQAWLEARTVEEKAVATKAVKEIILAVRFEHKDETTLFLAACLEDVITTHGKGERVGTPKTDAELLEIALKIERAICVIWAKHYRQWTVKEYPTTRYMIAAARALELTDLDPEDDSVKRLVRRIRTELG